MSNKQASALSGAHVLLVEDQALIALDAEDYLRVRGAARVTIAATADAALRQVEVERPDVAVLDVNLGDHTSAPVADLLASLGVPFIVASGHGDASALAESLRSAPIASKPYTEATLIAAIETALARKGGR